MKASKIVALACTLAFLDGCGSPEAQLPNPTNVEAMNGVLRLLRATSVSAKITVPAGQPTQCMPGKLGEVDVRTCKVCAITVYTRAGTGDFWDASVRRELFDVAFKRGQSFDQPDISPPNASEGVWVSVMPVAPNQFAPPQIMRTAQAVVEVDYAGAAALFGLNHRRSFGQQIFTDQNGGHVRSQDVLQRLKDLPMDRLISIVGECPAS